MAALDRLEAWQFKHKERWFELSHDDGYGASWLYLFLCIGNKASFTYYFDFDNTNEIIQQKTIEGKTIYSIPIQDEYMSFEEILSRVLDEAEKYDENGSTS